MRQCAPLSSEAVELLKPVFVEFSGEPGSCRAARSDGAARGVAGSVTGADAHPDDKTDGRWQVGKKRQVIYARAELPVRDRIAAANGLVERGRS